MGCFSVLGSSNPAPPARCHVMCAWHEIDEVPIYARAVHALKRLHCGHPVVEKNHIEPVLRSSVVSPIDQSRIRTLAHLVDFGPKLLYSPLLSTLFRGAQIHQKSSTSGAQL